MTNINELLDKIGMNRNCLIFCFEDKHKKKTIDEQDKKHIRILATLELARDRKMLEKVLNSKFKEEFKYDDERDIAIYKIIFIKERRTKANADA